jgi:hypothetical protein
MVNIVCAGSPKANLYQEQPFFPGEISPKFELKN